MPYTMEWIIEGRFLALTYSGKITPEELQEMDAAIIEQLRHYPQNKIDVIADASQIEGIPPLSRISRVFTYTHEPNLTVVAIIGMPTYATVLAQLLAQILRIKYRPYKSKAEAIAYLVQQDPSLRDGLPDDLRPSE